MRFFNCIARLRSIRNKTAASENTCRGLGKEVLSRRSATGLEDTTRLSQVRETLEVKVESDLSVETLFAYLDEPSAPGFKVCLHDNKTYAIFNVNFLKNLRNLSERIYEKC